MAMATTRWLVVALLVAALAQCAVVSASQLEEELERALAGAEAAQRAALCLRRTGAGRAFCPRRG